MEEKFNEATPQRTQGHLLDAPLVSINIPVFIEQLKQEAAWKESDRNTITVFKTNGMRIVLIALHKGAEMATHTANGIISVQVLEGQMKFTADPQTVVLNKGQMLTLHALIPHSVLAIEETVFLLTLSTK
ncbi:cupin domain-containing protein [Ferruginibacter sp.]|uniref:cupin domain-containing protein n=1 Tax=Ferruginibacter sp. TaxID=1940288 RepID=UPI0026583160|nr:cupin domain-containing protein [Ferruginibacter sp.]